MRRFAYKALTPQGEQVDGEMEADDESAVIESLQESKLYPLAVHQPSERQALLGSMLRRDRVSPQEVLNFTRELATMLGAGLPLIETLNILSAGSRNPLAGQVIDSVRADVEAGKSLSSSLGRHGALFPPFYVNLVRAGEASGSLELVFERLAEYLESRSALRQAIVAALTYPAILLFVSVGSVLALLMFVIPRFQPLFAEMGGALPWATQVVIALAEGLKTWWWLLVLLALAMPFAWAQLVRDEERKLRIDRLILRVPFLGKLVSKIEVARFCRTVGTLLGSGVPLLAAFDIARSSLNNAAFVSAMHKVRLHLEQGRGLARTMGEFEYFPDLAIRLIQLGENTGSLPGTMLKAAQIFDKEVDIAVKRFLTVFEPALILSMGLVISFIIIAILLAVLGLNDLVL